MNLTELKKKRNRLQKYTWVGLPLVVIGGWFFPKLGYLLLGCMAGAVVIALYKGRAWCNWMCPRGSFYDIFIKKISAGKNIPSLFRKKSFRILVLTVLISALGFQIYMAWGNADKVGLAMVIVLTVTTSIGILLGIIFHQRAWCLICPMGTLANFISTGKQPLRVLSSCVDCQVCEKVCPMQLKPYEYKNSVMGDNDCVKCSLCVTVCPKKALIF